LAERPVFLRARLSSDEEGIGGESLVPIVGKRQLRGRAVGRTDLDQRNGVLCIGIARRHQEKQTTAEGVAIHGSWTSRMIL